MYYLWEDKRSTKKKLIIHITNYKEISEDGKILIDGSGWIEAKLIFNNTVKNECIAYAQKYRKDFRK